MHTAFISLSLTKSFTPATFVDEYVVNTNNECDTNSAHHKKSKFSNHQRHNHNVTAHRKDYDWNDRPHLQVVRCLLF